MQDFFEYVNILKRKIKVNKNKVVFVCIGTKDVIGDSIGPMVGSYLKCKIGSKNVVGDIENNICSKSDLIYYYPRIKNKFIIAIDSALSTRDIEGEIFISEKPLVMGLGINDNKGIIGDLSIKAGISDINIRNEKYIKKMSNIIGKGIYYWYKN